jgi:hypothetical protein
VPVLERFEDRLAATSPLIAEPEPLLPIGHVAPAQPRLGDLEEGSPYGHLVVFLEYDCPSCRLLAADMARREPRATTNVQVTVVVDRLKRELGKIPPSWNVHVDTDRTQAAAWQLRATPVAYLLDAERRILAHTFPNTVRDLEKLVESVSADASTPSAVEQPTQHN